ncbi:HIT family protein [Epibacterium ulvae]|uniref:HIT family protein n=1 Tax=Epibacterium ulvae TaxID=1156985 RepID=UPI003CD0C948
MCIFCSIIRGDSPASFVHQDEICVAFMNIRPIHTGEFIIIPRDHIDHFTDLPDATAAHIMLVAQRVGRRLQKEFKPLRIGYVVHGFGVAHAQLNVVPLHHPSDIISARHITNDANELKISEANLAAPSRAELDAVAARLR